MLGAYTISYNGKAGPQERITPGDTATGITASVRHPTSGTYKGIDARAALLQNISNYDALICFDGTDPAQAGASAAVGLEFSAGATFLVQGVGEVKNLRIIDKTSGSATTVVVQPYF